IPLRDHARPDAQGVEPRLQRRVLETVGDQHRMDDVGGMLHHVGHVLGALYDETRFLVTTFFREQRQKFLDVGRKLGLEGRRGTRRVPTPGIAAARTARTVGARRTVATAAAAVTAIRAVTIGFAITVGFARAVEFPERALIAPPALAAFAIRRTRAIEFFEGTVAALTIRLAGAVRRPRRLAGPIGTGGTGGTLALARAEITREFLARFVARFV